MKIRFFYDTNHNFLSLCRFLRHRNIDAKLIVNLSIEPPKTYRIYDVLEDGDENLIEFSTREGHEILENPFTYNSKTVYKYLQKYIDKETITVGSYIAPAVFQYAGLKLDIMFTTGADTYIMPHLRFPRDFMEIKYKYNINLQKLLNQNRSIKEVSKTKTIENGLIKRIKNIYSRLKDFYQAGVKLNKIPAMQFTSIQNSIVALPDAHFLESWGESSRSLKIEKMQIPMAAVKDEENEIKRYSSFLLSTEIKKLRRNYDFILLSTNKNYPIYGTDKLVNGYVKFSKETSSNSLLIISTRGDLNWAISKCKDEFKMLVASGKIYLLPCIPANELDGFFEIADVAFGEISSINAFHSTTIAKILASGTPMIGSIPDDYEMTLKNVYPYMKAKTEVDVCHALFKLSSDTTLKEKISKNSKKWYKEFSNNSVDGWIKLFTVIQTEKNNS